MMMTFAPLLADSLEGFNKYFLSLFVNQGLQDSGDTQSGIKGIKVRKVLFSLYSLYSCQVGGWIVKALSLRGALDEACLNLRFFRGFFNTARNDRGFSLVL